jgi:hypothetical protein
MHATFRGKRYKILTKDLDEDTLGECDPPYQEKKEIRFSRHDSWKQLLDTHIHEALHACLWDLDEHDVSETARDIAAFLWRLGYRLDIEVQ